MTDHVHGPDCDHEHEESVFVIEDEDGVEREYMLVYTFESPRGAYAVLLQKDDPESDGVLMKIVEEEGDAYLTPIEDDEEWSHALELYESAVKEQQE
jgi:uncharacterized protein YrzB (UPF0473 family)